MLNTIGYAVGFVIYIVFMLYTVDIYSRKNPDTKLSYIVFIYVYLTILAAYVIDFTDINGTFFEIFVQIGLYVIAGGLMLAYYYTNEIIPAKQKLGTMSSMQKAFD